MSKHRPEKVDVVIAGAGASSSVFAAVLAEAGKTVLVLESGPARRSEDLISSQIWARRLKWATPHVADEGPDSIWYNFNAGRGFGGAAIHHFAVWPRYHEDDFRLQSEYGKGLDWPVNYDDLRPHYDQVQKDVGISGDAEKEIWRPPGEPYPLPPVPKFRHGELLQKGFDALDMHTAPLPLALLTHPYKGRAACIWDGWCDAGCPIGALANPLVEYFPRAQKAGAILQADSHVTRVLMNAKGDRATGVEYMNAAGESVTQLADTVVLAAFTVENVRILLNSAHDKHRGGIGNNNDMLGRYLMVHPSVQVFGMFDEPVYNYMGATGGQLICQDHFAKEKHPDGAFGSRQWAIAQALKPNDFLGIAITRPEFFGADLERFLQQGARSMAAMVSISEDQPQIDNRIVLSDDRDRFGMPLAKSFYRISDDGRTLTNQAAAEGLEIFRAAGAKDTWHGPTGGQHIMGGTIMGDDPKASVTDQYARVHGVDNLVIGGGSVFPTSSAVNSTFTIHAVSMRSALALR